MDMDHFGIAKVVKGLVVCAESLGEAMAGAQMAKDEPLFGKLYRKQTEIYELLGELVKTKQERTNAAG